MSPPTTVAFIGAGAVNFGLGNAWDHATRLEKMDVLFVGVSDPVLQQAERVIAVRQQDTNANKHKWAGIQVFADYHEMLAKTKPQCVFIGVPPNVHGSMKNPIELDCLEMGANIFIEKPISCSPPEQMAEFHERLSAAETHGKTVSVAYMFRYSKAMQQMKRLVETFGPVKLVQARYYCAYSKIGKDSWWDVDRSGGPIVEQATHFVDAARFLAGDADLSTVKAMSIKSSSPAGALSEVPVDEEKIPLERRVPRVTTAMWGFKTGAIGTLVHTVLLHGWNYETQFEVSGDGYYIVLRDPYGKCEITYRAPGSETDQVVSVPDDPYWTEIETFLEAARGGDKSKIASPYDDAFKTYELTWAIRRAAESACQM